jgi:hypothetical protein
MALTERERERERERLLFLLDRRGIMIGVRLRRFGKIMGENCIFLNKEFKTI